MNAKKRGLGKGLSALIQDKEKAEELISDVKLNPSEAVEEIEISRIIPKSDQPRKIFDEDALNDLKASIKENGVIQPIILRRKDDRYEIIAGERRWRAAKAAGLERIPSIVREIDEETAAKISLIENVQRENLNPIEEAEAYKRLMSEYSLKQEELAKAVGKSRSYISNSIRLLNLDERIIGYIYEGKLTGGHGKALLAIKNHEDQLEAANRIIELGMNVREAEEKAKVSKKRSKRNKKVKELFMIELEEKLMGALGTKVTLNHGRKSGRIEIEYYDDDDLERLIDLIVG
ncbi:ParB/RepB/Spo0J family partition protein [Gudongella oleilytica]|jgi:ParB family chromosome partitioning protein|uniref:ParB/RepB/Spo0J family partition protein n=1 Tax=Gudongella oleilytica TaxID=1582259 RepID=UPI002A36F032|nr:ParB/RepB/Spo0J family partition protein [Gudongella oleilytica]MDY0257567.1 ParB/RepB/Spo0J family partition protein [Gudongella oleilytica]HMM69193.1 ParB/RepB/Spo0J family partition protein [Gudongella oleilytica]